MRFSAVIKKSAGILVGFGLTFGGVIAMAPAAQAAHTYDRPAPTVSTQGDDCSYNCTPTKRLKPAKPSASINVTVCPKYCVVKVTLQNGKLGQKNLKTAKFYVGGKVVYVKSGKAISLSFKVRRGAYGSITVTSGKYCWVLKFKCPPKRTVCDPCKPRHKGYDLAA